MIDSFQQGIEHSDWLLLVGEGRCEWTDHDTIRMKNVSESRCGRSVLESNGSFMGGDDSAQRTESASPEMKKIQYDVFVFK